MIQSSVAFGDTVFSMPCLYCIIYAQHWSYHQRASLELRIIHCMYFKVFGPLHMFPSLLFLWPKLFKEDFHTDFRVMAVGIAKVFSRVEIRARCKTFEFFNTKLGVFMGLHHCQAGTETGLLWFQWSDGLILQHTKTTLCLQI